MIHNVFHVSQLKKFTGTATSGNFSPSPLLDTSQKEPEAITDRMTVKRRNRVVTKVLVQ